MNQKLILSSLLDKELYHKFGSFVKPGFISDQADRRILEQINNLHLKTEGNIPLETFNGSLPAISDYSVARAVLEDFAVRCYLNSRQQEVAKKLNMNGLLKFQELHGIISQEEIDGAFDLEEVKPYDGANAVVLQRYPTLLPPLDESLNGGISPGEECLIQAPPKTGKTHWLITLGGSYLTQEHKVIHIELENLIQDTYNNYNLLVKNKNILNNLILLDYNGYNISLHNIDSILKRYIYNNITSNTGGYKPPVLIIDYLDIIYSKYEDEVIRLKNLTKDLRKLGNKYNAIVLSATQGDTESWDSPTPGLKNLYGSKIGKAGSADIIIAYSQLAQEKSTGEGRLIVNAARGRDVKNRVIPVNCNWSTFTISYGA